MRFSYSHRSNNSTRGRPNLAPAPPPPASSVGSASPATSARGGPTGALTSRSVAPPCASAAHTTRSSLEADPVRQAVLGAADPVAAALSTLLATSLAASSSSPASASVASPTSVARTRSDDDDESVTAAATKTHDEDEDHHRVTTHPLQATPLQPAGNNPLAAASCATPLFAEFLQPPEEQLLRTHRTAASGALTARTLASVPEDHDAPGQPLLPTPLAAAAAHTTPRSHRGSHPRSRGKKQRQRLSADPGVGTSPPQLGMESSYATSAYPSEGESPGRLISFEGDRLVVDAILAAKQATSQVRLSPLSLLLN